MSSATPLVVLLHGFDSSCLEWRRLAPALEAQGVGVLAVDLLGWGFTERPQDVACDFSADAKLKNLEGLLDAVLAEQGGHKRPVALLGTSLGAAFAVDLALARPELVDGLVLMSPQIYVDGIGPMANLPRPAAALGVSVLGSEPLRSVANWMSYADPATFATEDAMRIGRLSVLTQGWADSTVDYMLSGGIAVSERIKELSLPVLGIFGRQDGIVEPVPAADRLKRDLSSGNSPVDVRWVEDCGHVPHLEQPAATAGLLTEWLQQQGLLQQDAAPPKQ
jgi:pimeloyl-ACP methyl ester carboxylesterase